MILDVETNGLPVVKKFGVYYHPKELTYYDNSRLIELGYSVYSNKNIKLFDVCDLIKPKEFNITNHNIHGITQEIANKNGLALDVVFNKLEQNLEKIKIIVGHNILFDITIILSECYRHGRTSLINKLIKKELICTMKLGKQYLNMQKQPSLAILYRSLFKKYILQKHRALDDVNLCAKCYFYMLTHV